VLFLYTSLSKFALVALSQIRHVSGDISSANTLEINQVLKQLMDAMNLKLVDFKIEFGKTETDQILLADEISPDIWRYFIR
jgi:phosphoribosylaminoimidazole-succinocarboxamide synthase